MLESFTHCRQAATVRQTARVPGLHPRTRFFPGRGRGGVGWFKECMECACPVYTYTVQTVSKEGTAPSRDVGRAAHG